MTFRAEPIQNTIAIVDKDGRPSFHFQRLWMSLQTTMVERIAAEFGLTAATVVAQQAADDAAAAAAVASTAAADAQTAADNVGGASSIATSGVTGLALTATDAGADATITISAHDRVYGGGVTVPVLGGSITGLAYSTDYWVYYDQPSRAGGAVTFVATTNVNTAIQTGDRHSVGAVRTPAAAAPAVDGNINYPPGIVFP
jgi:hypothetical protein